MLTATLGDSRVAQIFSSPSNVLGFGGYNHFTWGNARTGHRLKVVYQGGLSGDRSDQMLARLNSAISSGGGYLYIQVGANDIAQAASGYTTVNTVGPNQGTVVGTSNAAAICFANIQYAAQTFISSGGRIVTVCLEPGAENFSSVQIGCAIDLNQYLREFSEAVPQVVLFDTWREMHDPSLSSTTTIRYKAGYAQEAPGSGVHQSNLGGYMVGKAFADHIAANFPPTVYLPSDVNEVPANSLRNLLNNPLFMGTSGTAGAGASGTIPTNWTVDRSGGSGSQTVSVSTGTPADGTPGKECIFACTFAGAGDLLRVRQDASSANWSIGDVIEGLASCVIDAGATSLAGVWADLQQNDGTVTTDIRDMIPVNNVAIGADGCTLFLKTPPFTIVGKSGSPYVTLRLYAQGSGAGSATVRWRQAQIRKRFAP